MNKLDFPNRITVELTNRCNVSCTFCHRNDFEMPLGDMSMELYKKIIDEMSEHLPIALVPFFRGESLLHPQFREMIKYAKEKGIGPIQIFSNGLAFDEDLAKDLVDMEVEFISFSLDTLDEQIYSKSRRYGNLKRSIENVIRLCEICRDEEKKGKRVPEIQVSSVDIKEYKEGQSDFIEFWKTYADYIRIYEEHDGKGRFVNKEISERMNYISERKPCGKIFTDMIIYWDGRLGLCNYDWKNNVEIGNASDYSIKELWDSKTYEEIRKKHLNGNIDNDILCSTCEHWKAYYVDNHYLGKTIQGDYKNKCAE